jgi:tight adherence protein B
MKWLLLFWDGWIGRSPSLKWASVGFIGLAAARLVWELTSNAQCRPRRLLAAYIARLERALHAMFAAESAQRIVIIQIVGMVLVVAAATFHGLPYWWALLLLAAFGPDLYIARKRRVRTAKLEAQVEPFVLALANVLKTTPSIGTALAVVQARLPAPLSEEVGLVLKELRLGSTLDQALLNMSARVRIAELDASLSGVLVGGQVGGNLPEILSTSAATLRETARLARVVRSRTASGRIQLIVLALAPIVVVLGFQFVTPGYFEVLGGSALGVALSTIAGGLWIAAVVTGQKLLAVDI